MRLSCCCFVLTLSASGLLPATAQQQASDKPQAQGSSLQVTVPPQDSASGSPKMTVPGGAITREQAKDAEKAAKAQAKEAAKKQKDAEKQQKQAAKEASYLKLQDNEIAVPKYDAEGKAVKLPPCSPKDKPCQEKRKELLKEKRITLLVEDGTLTVDGWAAKARLNYDVKSFDYVYFSVPGYGTIVASPYRFLNATEAKGALDGQNLTIETPDKRLIQLSSVNNLAGKQKRSLFYVIDRDYTQPGAFASVGYGFKNHAPYEWPGALPPDEREQKEIARAPKLPEGMQARVATPCKVVLAGAVSRAPTADEKSRASALAPCPAPQPQPVPSPPASPVISSAVNPK